MNPASDIDKLASHLRLAERIVFLTGAGMSTESGIPDFRSPTGIYATITSETIFDLDTFLDDPAPFFEFARSFFKNMQHAEPNAGHRAITDLQERHGKDVAVCTQNIDMLHQRAGTTTVYTVHGTTETSTCTRCEVRRKTEVLWPLIESGQIPRHDHCGGVFKPDIVFFGEALPEAMFAASHRAIARADLLVVCGTSLGVYPAASLPSARRGDCILDIINRTPTPLDSSAHRVIRGTIGEALADAVARLGAR